MSMKIPTVRKKDKKIKILEIVVLTVISYNIQSY